MKDCTANWIIATLVLAAVVGGSVLVLGGYPARPTTVVHDEIPTSVWNTKAPPVGTVVVGIFIDNYGQDDVRARWASIGRWTGTQFINSYADDRGLFTYIVANRVPDMWFPAPAWGDLPLLLRR